MKLNTIPSVLRAGCAIVALCLGADASRAATVSAWTADYDTTWVTQNAWDTGIFPNEAGASAFVTNNITGTRNITLGQAITLGTLQIGSLDSAYGFVIGGTDALTLNNSGVEASITSSSGTAADQIDTPITLADNLTVDTSKTIALNGIIGGTGKSITKNGAGTLVLTNANTFSGIVTLNQGALRVYGDKAFGAVPASPTSGKVVINGGTLILDGGIMTKNRGFMINSSGLTISNDVYAGFYSPLEGAGKITKVGAGPLYLDTNSFSGGFWLKEGSIRMVSSTNTSGQVGSGDLTIENGTGISSFGTKNTYVTNRIVVNGDFTIGEATGNTGTLLLSGPMELGAGTRAMNVINYGAANVISKTISGSGGGVIKAGKGSISFNATNTYDGPTIVKAGTLGLGYAGSAGFGTITLGDESGAEAAWLTGGSQTTTNAIIVAAGGTGTKIIRNNGNASTGFSGPVTLNGDLTLSTGGTGKTTLSGEVNGPGQITINGGYATNRMILTRSNNFEGGIHLVKGVLQMGNHHALGTGVLTIEQGTVLASDSASNRQPTNDVVVNGDFAMAVGDSSGNGTIRLWGNVALGDVTRTITNGGTVGHSIHGVISGTAGLVKRGVQGVSLYGANTFSGGMTVAEGTVTFYGGSPFGPGSLTIGEAGSTNNAGVSGAGNISNDILVVAGTTGTRTISCTNDDIVTFSGNVDLGTAAVTFGGGSRNTVRVSGPVFGAGSVTVAGASPLNRVVFSANNTYGGATTLSGGTFIAANTTGSATSFGPVTVKTNAILAGTGAIDGQVTVQDGGTLAPGTDGLGILTVNNTVAFSSASTNLFELDKTAGTNDVLAASAINYAGTLVLTNAAGSLSGGETFKLFSTPAPSGNFDQIVLLGTTATAQFDPATGLLTVVGGMADYATNISYTFSAGSMSITWPETHKGWYVQSNSVDVANSAAWFDVQDSNLGTSLNVQVDSSTPHIFFRLRKP